MQAHLQLSIQSVNCLKTLAVVDVTASAFSARITSKKTICIHVQNLFFRRLVSWEQTILIKFSTLQCSSKLSHCLRSSFIFRSFFSDNRLTKFLMHLLFFFQQKREKGFNRVCICINNAKSKKKTIRFQLVFNKCVFIFLYISLWWDFFLHFRSTRFDEQKNDNNFYWHNAKITSKRMDVIETEK